MSNTRCRTTKKSQFTSIFFVKLTPSLQQLKYLSKCSNHVMAQTTEGSGFDSIQKERFCSIFKEPRPALGPTKLTIQWLKELLPLELSGVDVNLTTHLYLVPRLIMRQNITVFPHTSLPISLGRLQTYCQHEWPYNLLAFCKNTTQRFNRRTLDMKHRAQHNILISAFVNRIIRCLIAKPIMGRQILMNKWKEEDRLPRQDHGNDRRHVTRAHWF